MVYVTRDGTVAKDMPWGLSKVTTIFWGFINLIFAFFQTLIPGLTDSNDSRSNFRPSGGGWRRGGGGGGGGGGGWWGGGSGGPRPGGGPGGNIRTLGSYDSAPSSCPAGGCCGGS